MQQFVQWFYLQLQVVMRPSHHNVTLVYISHSTPHFDCPSAWGDWKSRTGIKRTNNEDRGCSETMQTMHERQRRPEEKRWGENWRWNQGYKQRLWEERTCHTLRVSAGLFSLLRWDRRPSKKNSVLVPLGHWGRDWGRPLETWMEHDWIAPPPHGSASELSKALSLVLWMEQSASSNGQTAKTGAPIMALIGLPDSQSRNTGDFWIRKRVPMATNVVLLVVVLVLLLVVIIVFLSLRLCRFSTDRNQNFSHI